MKLPYETEVIDDKSKEAEKVLQPAVRSAGILSRASVAVAKVGQTSDDSTLLDIHVGNPLRRITELLKDIKQQKAFSFTLKGSLGIMGVALTLSVFGVFGGMKAFCDKGLQSQIGTIRYLSSSRPEPSDVILVGPLIDSIKNLFAPIGTNSYRHRIILVTPDQNTIHLPYKMGVDYSLFQDKQVIVTGQYDSCTKILKPERGEDIEVY